VCGIDIGKAGMVATIRVPSEKVLAQLARTAARRKISQLESARAARYSPPCARTYRQKAAKPAGAGRNA
jgi:hypothetical protein